MILITRNYGTQNLQSLGDYSPWGFLARKDNYPRKEIALGAIFFVKKSLTLQATKP
jgi:hypothetical protein